MGVEMGHRGPDDSGVWFDEGMGAGLSHRRLAIQDLSPLGHQPMHSSSGRYVIAFNGEIYNFRTLARELEGRGARFKGGSDTEVLLEGIEHWGLEETVRRCFGMFAIALVDRQQRTLSLARDAMGEKPLYYGWLDGLFVFASQIRPLEAVPGWTGSLDPEAVCLLLRHNYIPAPWSIYRNVRKLPPATTLTVDLPGTDPAPKRYWQLPGVDEPLAAPQAGPASESLETILRQVISEQMISDRPLGAFLSGGVDSSLVVALMQETASVPVKTFTIGFEEPSFNEAEHAKRIAQHLGTDHYEEYVSPDAGLELIPSLSDFFDEPYADSSQLPTMLVSRLARKQVTVALTGDGGDEHFAGYPRYATALERWDRISALPPPLRNLTARTLSGLDRPWVDRALMPPLAALSSRFRGRSVAAFGRYRAMRWSAPSLESMYLDDVQIWRRPAQYVRGLRDEPRMSFPRLNGLEPVRRLMAMDVASYLPDDILVKVDRATMHVALEGRAPLLDRRVVDAAWRLPVEQLGRGALTKWPLREILYKRVPRELIERPKSGFAVPLGSWLRGPLRPWAENLLSETALRRLDLVDVDEVRRRWRQHLAGERDNAGHMWCVLMLSEWIERRRERRHACTT